MSAIYLDHNATTPVDPAVLEAMLPLYKEHFGNPSSVHGLGRAARVRLDEAREQVASLIGAHPNEIVFTSGGTEADNLALFGVAWALREKGNHILTSCVEHPAILNPCARLAAQGFEVEYLPVDRRGRLDAELVAERIKPSTLLISVHHANSEMGTIQPIESIGALARKHGILFHTDAVQTAGKIPIDVRGLPVDFLSLSAHKMYGPKGVGALYVRKGTPPLVPLIVGGGQEKKRRGGTENVPGIVGFGRACALGREKLESDTVGCGRLRERLRTQIMNSLAGVAQYGDPEHCLPNTLCLGFEGVEGQSLLIRLDIAGIAVSTGTACSSGSVSPSEVLTAMGYPPEEALRAVRISLGRGNTEAEIDRAARVFESAVTEIREKSSILS